MSERIGMCANSACLRVHVCVCVCVCVRGRMQVCEYSAYVHDNTIEMRVVDD